jgi:hypothetical protein
MTYTTKTAEFGAWTLDQFAAHYACTLKTPANAWGQHISPLFGQSHQIMTAAGNKYPSEDVRRAFEKAVRENP